MFDLVSLGKIIKKYRNITIEQLSERLEISWRHLSNIERGFAEHVSASTIISLLNYFEISFEDFLDKSYTEEELIKIYISNKTQQLSAKGKACALSIISLYKGRSL